MDTAKALTPSGKKVEIVIIDNDSVTCIIQEAKVKQKFSQPLHVFEDAREALDHLTQAADTDYLVLLDIDMPVMDGWEFLAEWQKIDRKPSIKVIMLSCSISTADKERSRKYAEVVDYFEKPLYDSALVEIERVISSF